MAKRRYWETKSHGFRIDEERLRKICVAAYEVGETEKVRKYLPQFNLPPELEYNPRQARPSDPFQAALYLWTCVFFERITKSSQIIANARKTWEKPSKKWIFNPNEVSRRELPEIEDILLRDFQFGLKGKNEETPGKRFFDNAKLLVKAFDGDPRNLIKYNHIEQARKNLMEFKGIGSGIANLFIIYLMERGIAFPRDPESAYLKVDVHKGRIPINCGAVNPTQNEIARDDTYVRVMEHSYRAICHKENLDVKTLDASLWVIGSEICPRKDYSVCRRECPLVDLCKGPVPEDKKTGRYVVLSVDGLRTDSRINRDQESFKF